MNVLSDQRFVHNTINTGHTTIITQAPLNTENMTTFVKFYRVKCKFCSRIAAKSNQLPGNMRLNRKGYPDQLFLSWSGVRSSTTLYGDGYGSWLDANFHIRDEESYGSITIAKIKCRGCCEELGWIRVYNESSRRMRGKVYFKDPEEKVKLEKRLEQV